MRVISLSTMYCSFSPSPCPATERCLRCLPQDEDTGGFFVATLRKKMPDEVSSAAAGGADEVGGEEVEGDLNIAELDAAEAAAVAAAADDADDAPEGNAAAAAAGADEEEVEAEPATGEDSSSAAQGEQEEKKDATAPVAPDAAAIAYRKGMVDFHQFDLDAFAKLQEFYGMTSALPPEAFFVREDFSLVGRAKNGKGSTAGNAKSVYFVPFAARQLMKGDREQRLKIVSAGVKVFEKKVMRNGMIDYRMLQVLSHEAAR